MAYIPVISQGVGNGASSPWSVSGTIFIKGVSAIGQTITDVNAPILMAINDKGGVARFLTSANAVSGSTGQGLAGAGNLVLGPDALWRGMQGDVNGNTVVVSKFTATCLSGNVTTTLKGAAGILHSVVINTKGASSNTITLYDNPSAAAGIKIAAIDTTIAQQTLLYDISFTTGLTIVMTTGTAADVTITWL